jgi:hypothetical protein
MSKMRQKGAEKPWPRDWLCRDGIRRDIAEFRPEQWDDHGGGPGYRRKQWFAERSNAARSLNRKLLPELSAQLRVGR